MFDRPTWTMGSSMSTVCTFNTVKVPDTLRFPVTCALPTVRRDPSYVKPSSCCKFPVASVVTTPFEVVKFDTLKFGASMTLLASRRPDVISAGPKVMNSVSLVLSAN